MTKLQLYREMPIKDDCIRIGDRIRVDLPGESHMATAIEKQDGAMLFLLDEYLDETRPMNADGRTEGGYDGSDLRVYLQELSKDISEDLKQQMVPFENGDILTILSLQEMFGMSLGFKIIGGQIGWLKNPKNRIAVRKGNYEWGWLRDVASSVYFVGVNHFGNSSYNLASASYGVRPAFRIKILRGEEEEMTEEIRKRSQTGGKKMKEFSVTELSQMGEVERAAVVEGMIHERVKGIADWKVDRIREIADEMEEAGEWIPELCEEAVKLADIEDIWNALPHAEDVMYPLGDMIGVYF